MRSGLLRIVSAFFALATLGLGNAAAYAAEPVTPVDSNRTIGDDSPFGAFLFHNDNGWHFRTHGNPHGTTFTARIATNGTIRDVAAVRDEQDDHIKLDAAGHALELSFATFTGVDGVDFRLDDAKYVRVRIEADGQLLPTDNEGSHAYTGTLTTSGTIEVVDLVKPEKDDSLSLSSDGHNLSFTFSTQEGVDGAVLRVTGAEQVKLSLDTDGQLTPVSSIHLGLKDRTPRTNPFEIRV